MKDKGAVPRHCCRYVKDHWRGYVEVWKDIDSLVAALVGLVDNKVLAVYSDIEAILV